MCVCASDKVDTGWIYTEKRRKATREKEREREGGRSERYRLIFMVGESGGAELTAGRYFINVNVLIARLIAARFDRARSFLSIRGKSSRNRYVYYGWKGNGQLRWYLRLDFFLFFFAPARAAARDATWPLLSSHGREPRPRELHSPIFRNWNEPMGWKLGKGRRRR